MDVIINSDIIHKKKMKLVTVQEEIKVLKCNSCDKYGRSKKIETNGSIYYPYCDCPFGKWMDERNNNPDMFCAVRGQC